MNSPSFFYIKGDDSQQQYIFKSEKKLSDNEKELIGDMMGELIKEKKDKTPLYTEEVLEEEDEGSSTAEGTSIAKEGISAAKPRTITIQTIDVKTRTITYKVLGEKANTISLSSSPLPDKKVKIQELFAEPKKSWKQNFLNKVGKWSFFVPVVGWGVGTAWLISRHHEKKKLLQLTTQAKHQVVRGKVRDVQDFIDAHQTMINKLERLKKDVPQKEAENIDAMIQTLKASQKDGARMLKCQGDISALNQLAREIAAKIQNPPVLIPSYYTNAKGEIQPFLLHFYKDDNDELCLQRIEVNPDAKKVFDNFVYKINPDANLEKMLQGILRFQIPPEKHEEKLDDKTTDKIKLVAKKSREKSRKEEVDVKMPTDPGQALSTEILAYATLLEDESKKASTARAPTILKPFQIFAREQFGEDTYSKLIDLRDQMETLTTLATMLSKESQGSLTERIEKLNNIIGLMEEVKDRAKKKIGHEEAWSFFMEEKEQQFNALIEECRQKVRIYESKLSKNRPKLIERLGRKEGGWKEVKVPQKVLWETQDTSIAVDSHLERLEELSKAKSLTPSLSMDKRNRLAHLTILGALNDVLGGENAPLKAEEYAQRLKDADDEQLEEIFKKIMEDLSKIYPKEGSFQVYDESQKNSLIKQLINEIRGNHSFFRERAAWAPVISFLIQLQEPSQLPLDLKEEIELVEKNYNKVEDSKGTLSSKTDKGKEKVSEIEGNVDNAIQTLSTQMDETYESARKEFENRLSELRKALDAPLEGNLGTYNRRLRAIDQNITKLIEELPIPTEWKEIPSNYWMNISPDDINRWETHLRDAMAIWTETRARLGETTVAGRQFVIMARGMTIANHLFRIKGKHILEQMDEKWEQKFATLADNDPIKAELLQLNHSLPRLNSRAFIFQKNFFALGRIGKLLGFEKEELLPILNSDYSVGREMLLENLRKNATKLSSLPKDQNEALKAIIRFYNRSEGGMGGTNKGNTSDITFLGFDKLSKTTSTGGDFPERDYIENTSEFLAGYNAEANQTEYNLTPGMISRSSKEAFTSVADDENTYFDPALTKALQVHAYCRMLLDTSRLGLAFKDDQQAMFYFLSKIKNLPIEIIEKESLDDVVKRLIKQDDLKTLLKKIGPWKLRCNPENFALEITDEKETDFIQYSESSIDLGFFQVTKEQTESSSFAQLSPEQKIAFSRAHRYIIALNPTQLRRELSDSNVGIDPEANLGKTPTTEIDIQNECFREGLETGLTPEQETDLATLEIATLGPLEFTKKVVHFSTVNQVFAFIAAYPNLLSNIGVQQRLRDILNRPELLQRALHLDPEAFVSFGILASELIKKELEKTPSPEGIRTVLFLTELCYLFQIEITRAQTLLSDPMNDDYAGKGEEGIYMPTENKPKEEYLHYLSDTLSKASRTIPSYTTPIKDSSSLEEILKTWSNLPDKDIQDMAKEINLYIIQSYFSQDLASLSEDQWIDLFKAYALVANTGGTVFNRTLENAVKDWMINEAVPTFKTHVINDPNQDKNKTLSNLATTLLPSVVVPPGGDWKEVLPGLYQCGGCTLDLTRALVFDQNGKSNSSGPLPSQVREHPLVLKIFRGSLSPAINAECRLGSKPGTYTYQFTHRDRTFQIHLDSQSQEVTISQEIEIKGKKHFYVYDPSPLITGKGSQQIIQEKGLWRRQNYPQEALCLLEKQDKPTPENTLHLYFKVQKGPSLLSVEKVLELVTRRKGTQPENNLELYAIKTSDGKEVINTNPESLEDLFGFVDPKDVLLIGSKGKVEEIRFLYLNLTLKHQVQVVDGKKQLVWKAEGKGQELNDCILLSDGSMLTDVFGPNFKNFMLPLYDVETHTYKLVMRPLEIQSLKVENEETRWLNTDVEDPFRSSRFIVCFNPQDARLTATTDGFMNLAYMAAAEKQYERAVEYLSKAVTAPAPTDPAERQKALKVMQRLVELIRKLPRESTNADLFRLKFELAQMKIMHEQFGQEEFQLKSYQNRLKEITEISNLYEQVMEKQKKQPVSGLLKLTPGDIQQYEGFVRESLKFLFEKIEEKSEPQGAYLYVKVPGANTDGSLLAAALADYAQKPNPNITTEQIPAYLTYPGLFRNFPSYWNDIVKNRKGTEAILPLLRSSIAESNENNQYLIKQAISMLFALSVYISTLKDDADLSGLYFPEGDFPEASKLHGEMGITNIIRLTKIGNFVSSSSDFLNNFIVKIQKIPEDQKIYKSSGVEKEHEKLPSEPVTTIDEILEKLDDPEYKDYFTKEEVEEWKKALAELQDEMVQASSEEDYSDKLEVLELTKKLIAKGVAVPLQRYQMVLEQRIAVEETPPITPAVPQRPTPTPTPAPAVSTTQEWNDIKAKAFNQISPLQPHEETLTEFKQKIESSKKVKESAKLKIKIGLTSENPVEDLLNEKGNLRSAKGTDKALLWYKIGCLELKVAEAKLKSIEQNLKAANAPEKDVEVISKDIEGIGKHLKAIQENLKNDELQNALQNISWGLVDVQKALSEAKAIYVKNALSIPKDIDENLEEMIIESNRLTTEAASKAKVKEEARIRTSDIVHLDQVEELEEFIKAESKAVDHGVSEARKKVLELSKELSTINLIGSPKEVQLFKEKVSKFSEFSEDDILRFATDLYVDDYLRNVDPKLADYKRKALQELHEAIENFMTLQIQQKGITNSAATLAKLARLKRDYKAGKINTTEKMEAFEVNWNIASKEMFSLLERSQKVERHKDVPDDLVRRSIIRMEWKQGFPLREEQITFFLKLLENPEELLLFRTGGGKTSVFFPLAVEIFLKQGRLPFQLVTEKLHQQFLADMDPKTRELFAQGAYPFEWSLNTIFKPNPKKSEKENKQEILQNISYLQDRHAQLVLAQKEKNRYPVARIRDVASLRHDLTELQKLIKERNVIIREGEPEDKIKAKRELDLILQQYHWTKKIWAAIHADNVSFLADEPDAIVPATKEVNRASGASTTLSAALPLTIQPVLEAILDPTKRPAGSWPALDVLQKAIMDGRQETLSVEQREEAIKSIGEIIYKDANKYLGDFIEKYFHNDLKKFQSEVKMDEFVSFMTSKPTSPDEAVKRPDGFPVFPEEISEKDSFNSLLILKDWLGNVLDTSLQKQPGNKYGIDRGTNCTIVPYEDWEQEPQANMYSNPLLIVTLTYLYYTAFPFKESFLRSRGESDSLDDWGKRFEFLKDPSKVFDRVPIYDQQYRCNTQHAVLGVRLGGASATGEVYALPFKKSKEPPNAKELLVNASMTINEMGKGLEAEIEEFTDPQAAFNEEIVKKEVKAIIDQAGSLKGKTNNEAVKGLLTHLESKGIDTVINFVDSGNRQKKQEGTKIDDKPTPASAQQKMYYGPKDGRGTHFDIPAGEGVIFFGANVSEEEMLQTIGRLRELGKGHTVRFRLDQAVAKKIRATLNLPASQPVKIKELFQYIELSTIQAHAKTDLKAERLRIQATSLTAFEKAHLKPQEKNPREWSLEDFTREATEAEIAYDVAETHQLGLSKQTDTRSASYKASTQGDTYDQLLNEREAERIKLAGICADAVTKILEPEKPDEFATDLKEHLLTYRTETVKGIMNAMKDQDVPKNIQKTVEGYFEVYSEALTQCEQIIADMKTSQETRDYHVAHLAKTTKTSDLSQVDNEQEVEIAAEEEQEQEEEEEQTRELQMERAPPREQKNTLSRIYWNESLLDQLIDPTIKRGLDFFTTFQPLNQMTTEKGVDNEGAAILFGEERHFRTMNHALLTRNAKQTGSGMRLAVVGIRPNGSYTWLHIDKCESSYEACGYIAVANLDKGKMNVKSKDPKLAVIAITPEGTAYPVSKTASFKDSDLQSDEFVKDLIRHKIFLGHINFPAQQRPALIEAVGQLSKDDKDKIVDLILEQRGVKSTSQIYKWTDSDLYHALQGTLKTK